MDTPTEMLTDEQFSAEMDELFALAGAVFAKAEALGSPIKEPPVTPDAL